MSDEHAIPERATISKVYEVVNSLAASVDAKLGKMDDSMREQFTELRTLFESVRSEMPTFRDCQHCQAETDASIKAAVKTSEHDRQKIWDAVHGIESQLKWAAGIVITAFLGLVIYLMQGHIVP